MVETLLHDRIISAFGAPILLIWLSYSFVGDMKKVLGRETLNVWLYDKPVSYQDSRYTVAALRYLGPYIVFATVVIGASVYAFSSAGT
jgi:hypothetical protein